MSIHGMPRSARLPRGPGLGLTLGLAFGLGGCAGGLGVLGDILTAGDPAAGGQGVVTVEVQEVRQARQDIVVRTQDGQQGPILYDQATQVVYQNQQYPVTSLERGDIVDMRVHQVQQGYYTDLIQVRTPVQERTAGTGGGTAATPAGVYRIEGTIGAIDTGASRFTLNMTQGGTVEIVIPSGAPAADHERLRQHRAGDYVRVEVRAVDQQSAELIRFGWS
jgi:hypothetical protein